MKGTKYPANEIHSAKPGVDPKPKHLADGYEHTRCSRCHNKVGYAEYDARIEDDAERGLVYVITHVTDCSRW